MQIPSGTGGGRVSDELRQTIDEHYEQHSDALDTIRKELDGYASDQTVSEHYEQHSDALDTIIKELDGYASSNNELAQTVSEHYEQHSDALDTIRKELDGYVSSEDTPNKNDHIIWNGSAWVFAPDGTTFTFSIATFTDNGGSSVVEIGEEIWKNAGELTFSATYNNGPATNGYVSLSGWGSNLTLTGGSFEGPTVTTEGVSYPVVGGNRSFVLHATDGSDSDTDANTYYFYNRRFWGATSTSGSYTEADIEGLSGNELSNSRAKTFTVNAGAGEYIVYSYPTRLGTATFTVGGFEGGFESPELVSVTNSSGYTETYYVYRSTNASLGSTTVVVS